MVDIYHYNLVLTVLYFSISLPGFIIATAFINVEVRKGDKKVGIIKIVFKFCFIKNEQYFLFIFLNCYILGISHHMV